MNHNENILAYTRDVLQTFDEKDFNEVDSLIFSWLAYLNYPTELPGVTGFEGVPLREIWKGEYLHRLIDGVNTPSESLQLLALAAASPRFRDVRVCLYIKDSDPDEDKQFAAVTFRIGERQLYIAYRGTDHSFAGWKEDLNLSLTEPVPSQLEARDYLRRVTEDYTGTILVGGHSKGGNIAVYASAFCDPVTQSRILRIYSHDGPGFSAEEIESEGFKNIRPRIEKTLPQSSLVGLFMEQECPYTIIQSTGKSIGQHCPFTWKVDGDRFVRAEALTPDAKVLYRSVNTWLGHIEEEDRVTFIDAIFQMLESTETDDFVVFASNLKEKVPLLISEARSLDADTKKLLSHLFRDLIATSAKTVPQVMLGEKIEKIKGKEKEKNSAQAEADPG